VTKKRGKSTYMATQYVPPDHGAIVRRYTTCGACAAEIPPVCSWTCPACGVRLSEVRLAVVYEDGAINSADPRVRRTAGERPTEQLPLF